MFKTSLPPSIFREDRLKSFHYGIGGLLFIPAFTCLPALSHAEIAITSPGTYDLNGSGTVFLEKS